VVFDNGYNLIKIDLSTRMVVLTISGNKSVTKVGL